jgi:hypothetical protein
MVWREMKVKRKERLTYIGAEIDIVISATARKRDEANNQSSFIWFVCCTVSKV